MTWTREASLGARAFVEAWEVEAQFSERAAASVRGRGREGACSGSGLKGLEFSAAAELSSFLGPSPDAFSAELAELDAARMRIASNTPPPPAIRRCSRRDRLRQRLLLMLSSLRADCTPSASKRRQKSEARQGVVCTSGARAS